MFSYFSNIHARSKSILLKNFFVNAYLQSENFIKQEIDFFYISFGLALD